MATFENRGDYFWDGQIDECRRNLLDEPVVEYLDLLADGPDVIDFVEWAEDELEVDDWVEGFLTVDRDGARRTVLVIDASGPSGDFLEADRPVTPQALVECADLADRRGRR